MGKGSEVWNSLVCAGSHSNNSAWMGTKNSRKGVQRHLGNEKGMLCDPDLPHSMLRKWKTDGKYAPKYGSSMALGEAGENLVPVREAHRTPASNPWAMAHFLPWSSPKAKGWKSSSHTSSYAQRQQLKQDRVPPPHLFGMPLSTAKPSLPWLPCGMEIVQKSPKGPMKDTKVVYSAAGKLSRRLPKWGASGQTTWIENQMGNHHTWKKYIAPESWQGKLTRQETEGLKYSSHRCSQKVPVTRYTGKSFLRRWRRSKEQHGTGAHILVPARPIPQQHGKQTQVPTGHVEAKTGREHWNT